jgi:hypothetical protein
MEAGNVAGLVKAPALNAVAVYCGSSMGQRPVYRQTADALGTLLASRSIELVYGGGNVGLMGTIADATLAAGGRVYGVIPDCLVKWEVAHTGLSEQHVVPTMHERKQLMADRADAFIAMPGGIGTLEELFEVYTWVQIGLHNKPLAILNIEGYYDHLLAFLDHAVAEGLFRAELRNRLLVDTDVARLLDRLAAAQDDLPTPKWANRDVR